MSRTNPVHRQKVLDIERVEGSGNEKVASFMLVLACGHQKRDTLRLDSDDKPEGIPRRVECRECNHGS